VTKQGNVARDNVNEDETTDMTQKSHVHDGDDNDRQKKVTFDLYLDDGDDPDAGFGEIT
jgi:hypothetical protein